MLHSDWFSLIMLVSANMSITMMQGDNGNIMMLLGITSFTNYLVIYMIYHCGVVFCLYNIMALYNITSLFLKFTAISEKMQDKYIALYSELITQLYIYTSAIRILAKGYLPISLVTPSKLKFSMTLKLPYRKLTQIMIW